MTKRRPIRGREDSRDYRPLGFWEKLDRFPPVVIRLLARVPEPGGQVRALTTAEVAAGAGLAAPDVVRVSQLVSWDRVPTAELRAFCRGCGADLDSRDWLRKNARYMASIRGIPRYLRRSPEWPMFEALMLIWIQHETGKAA